MLAGAGALPIEAAATATAVAAMLGVGVAVGAAAIAITAAGTTGMSPVQQCVILPMASVLKMLPTCIRIADYPPVQAQDEWQTVAYVL